MNFDRRTPFRLVLCLLALLCLTNCHNTGGGTQPQGNGEGILGRNTVADAKNSELFCTFKTKDPLHYSTNCATVVMDAFGQIKATKFAENLLPSWKSVAQIAGPTIASLACTVSANLLEQNCEVTLANTGQVEIAYALDLKDKATSAVATKLARVLLPFTAFTIGQIVGMPTVVAQSSEVTGGRGLTRWSGGEEVQRLGVQTPALPTEDFPGAFSAIQVVGQDLYFPGNTTYRLTKDGTLHLYSALSSSTIASQPDSPLQALDSHPLRLNGIGLMARTITEDGVLLLRSDETKQELIEVLHRGGSVLRGTFPKLSNGEYAIGGASGASFLAKAAEDTYIAVSTGRIDKIKNGQVTRMAGLGGTAPSGHVETEAATSLEMFNYASAVESRGSVLTVDNGHTRVARILPNDTYQILYSDPTCWNAPQIAAGANGKSYLFARTCSSVTFRELTDTSTREIFSSTNAGTTGCAQYPRKGTKVAAASIPFYAEGMNLAAVDSVGPLFTNACGVFRLRIQESLVEALITTVPDIPNGRTGDKISNVVFAPIDDIAFLPNGDLAVKTSTNIHTVSLKNDTIQTLSLTLNGNPWTGSGGITNMVVSPSGGIYLLRTPTTALFRISPTGEMLEVASMPADISASVVLESDTSGYVKVSGYIDRLNLTDGTRERIVDVPTDCRTVRSNSMALGPNGFLYLISSNALCMLTAFDGTKPFFKIMGGGNQPRVDGALARDMKFTTAQTKKIAVEANGTILYGDDLTLNALVPSGTRITEDGEGYPGLEIPTHKYELLHPKKRAQDCGATLAGTVYSDSSQGIDPAVNFLCPTKVASSSTFSSCPNGSMLSATAGNFAGKGRILVFSRPCPNP